jgi:hypothetical protein
MMVADKSRGKMGMPLPRDVTTFNSIADFFRFVKRGKATGVTALKTQNL